jgi:hypothetical protein
MLREAYGDDAWGQKITYKWFKHFKNGRTTMDDNEGLTNLQLQDPNVVSPGEKRYPWKLSNDCPRSCIRGWNIYWFMTHNFNIRFRNVPGLNKISAKILD